MNGWMDSSRIDHPTFTTFSFTHPRNPTHHLCNPPPPHCQRTLKTKLIFAAIVTIVGLGAGVGIVLGGGGGGGSSGREVQVRGRGLEGQGEGALGRSG